MPRCDDPCLQSERQVLLEIKRLLGGKSLKNRWKVKEKTETVNNTFHCNWYGILCEKETKHVLAISLSQKGLNGTVALNFADLQFLLSLRMDRNPVQGQFDKMVGTIPKHLLRMDFAYTRISGRIPKSIANSLPFLSKLQLSENFLSSEIPDSIGKLINLAVPSLGHTRINGSVPHSLSKLTNLWSLELEGLKLKGNLSFIYNLRQLQYLNMFSNGITGEIPKDIGERCPNLVLLILSTCRLSGKLPRSISKLKHLSVMNVEKTIYRD